MSPATPAHVHMLLLPTNNDFALKLRRPNLHTYLRVHRHTHPHEFVSAHAHSNTHTHTHTRTHVPSHTQVARQGGRKGRKGGQQEERCRWPKVPAMKRKRKKTGKPFRMSV